MYRNELPFLNVIRGASALFVLFFHFFIFFFTQQPMSAGLINAEPLILPDPEYLAYITAIPINIGHLGVTFFFLMSGFFIQPSLEKYNLAWPFLFHKFLRLWPTYAFSFAIGLGFVFFFSLLREDIYPYSFDHVLSYFFWVRDLFGYGYIDGSVWSLEIQVKYYVLAALIWYLFRHKFLEALIVIIIISCFLGLSINYIYSEEYSHEYLLYIFNRNVKYFLLITMGACFYPYYKKKISLLKFSIFQFLLVTLFISPIPLSLRSELLITYCFGLFLFACSLFFKDIGKKSTNFSSKLMGWFAKISYPLYVGHVLPGYTIMYYLLEKGVNVYLAIFAALAVVFPLAYLVHEYIEKVFSSIKVEGRSKTI